MTSELTLEQRQFVDSYLDAAGEELIAFRRRMHSQPELSGEEYATTESIVSRLLVADLNPIVLPSGTGVICDVSSPGAGPDSPIVAIRCDIDALAMNDESYAPYASTRDGVAHCCGHDVHTTIVLGAGLLLTRLLQAEDAPVGTVRLIFEPSEETIPGGSVEIVAEGYLKDVGAIYGLHCDPKVDIGHVGVTDGAVASAADVVELDVLGPGGHTARPENTVDMIRVAAALASELPRRMSEATAGPNEVRLTFGSLQAGDAPNVIPTTAHLEGTMRAQNREGWQSAGAHLENLIEQELGPTGAHWRVDYSKGVPPIVNDPATTGVLREAVADVLGPEAIVPTEQSWGGDTFAWYLEEIPGTYVRLGTHDPESGEERLDLHAGTFDVDERSITIGVRLMTATALAWLNQAQAQ